MAVVLKPRSNNAVVVVPEGIHKATLSKVTQFSNAYGLRVGFEFTLHGEDVEGKAVMRSTNPILTAKSKLAEVLNGLLGRELTSAEINSGYDVDKLVGKDCNVLVLNSKGKNGTVYSNVERVFQAAA